LVISGLSKDLSMTGWRIGWVAGPESVISRIVAAHQYLVTCAPSISQWAALAAFGEAGEAERRRLLGRFGERRCSMESALRRIPGVHVNAPEGAFYFFLDVRSFGPSLGIADRLLEEWKVITIPGEAFGPGGEGFLRLSFAASETDIERGVDALAKVLAASRRSV
jgi:aspartate/methionine/tyrosine aminotransferase